jgi:Ca2+-binding EF-hand superfamily protein
MKRSDILMVVTAVAIGASAMASYASPRGGGEHIGFTELDVDGNGVITAEDFDALKTARFAALDSNGDGDVTRDEFMAAARIDSDDRAERMFDRLDADGDGVLARDVLEGRERGPNSRMIERFDEDGDGALSEEEFDAFRDRMASASEKRGGHRGGQRNR